MSNSPPKTVSQFINNYNKRIKETIANRIGEKADLYERYVNICTISSNAADVGGIKMRELYRGDAVFMSQEKDYGLQVQLIFHTTVHADALYPMMEAATLAAGDDYKAMFKKMGVLKDNKYMIRNAYEYEIPFGKNTYSLEWIDDAIVFSVVIPK